MEEKQRRDEERRQRLRREMRLAALTFGGMFLLAFLLALLWAHSVSGAETPARAASRAAPIQPAGGGGQVIGGAPFFSALN